jgi:hypothetical protein
MRLFIFCFVVLLSTTVTHACEPVPRASYNSAVSHVLKSCSCKTEMLSSSWLEAITYCEGDYLLMQVKDPSNSNPSGIYIFEDVPQAVFNQWVSASSAGSYYNEQVKGRYRFELQ